MSLEILENQPIVFFPPGQSASCKDCGGEACALFQDGDELFAQVKLDVCGDELICGQLNSGPELVTDGTFEEGGTHWDTTGTTWTFDDNMACYELLASPHSIFQTIVGLTEECRYRLVFTTKNVIGGQIRPTLWDTVGTPTPIAANGTFEEIITIAPGHVNETLLFETVGTWEGCITNISLVELPCCWNEVEAAEGTVISYTEDGVCINGSVSLISDVVGAIVGGGNRYVVTFAIFSYVAGEVDVQFGSANLIEGDYTGNGQKFAYDFFLGDTALALVFTNFIGCIRDISIKLLVEPEFYAVNMSSGEIVDLGTANTSFYEDRAILHLFLEGQSILAYGCHKICVVNRCGTSGDELIRNGEFTDDLGSWTAGNGWIWDNGQAHYFDSGVSAILSQDLEDGAARACAFVKVKRVTEGGELRFSGLLATAGVDSVIITEPGVYTICGLIDEIQLVALGSPGGQSNFEYVIDDVSVLTIEDCEECESYCSNCIKYASNLPCTLLVEAYNDENGSWDFVWNDGAGNVVFKLQHRLDATLGNPKYPEDSVDYTFSTGETRDTFAQSEKFWLLHIDQKDEIAHDCIRLQKRSDHLFITDENGNRKEYWAEKGDYNPKWVDPAGSNLAPAEFRVKLKNKTMYNNLCS